MTFSFTFTISNLATAAGSNATKNQLFPVWICGSRNNYSYVHEMSLNYSSRFRIVVKTCFNEQFRRENERLFQITNLRYTLRIFVAISKNTLNMQKHTMQCMPSVKDAASAERILTLQG